MKEPDYRPDAEIVLEHMYFLGSDGQGNIKIFDWLSYMAVVPRSEYLTYQNFNVSVLSHDWWNKFYSVLFYQSVLFCSRFWWKIKFENSCVVVANNSFLFYANTMLNHKAI